MTIAPSVASVISDHVTFELSSLDRLYLNLYVPLLQRPQGVAWYFTEVRGIALPRAR
jgi:hypothetical protein